MENISEKDKLSKQNQLKKTYSIISICLLSLTFILLVSLSVLIVNTKNLNHKLRQGVFQINLFLDTRLSKAAQDYARNNKIKTGKYTFDSSVFHQYLNCEISSAWLGKSVIEYLQHINNKLNVFDINPSGFINDIFKSKNEFKGNWFWGIYSLTETNRDIETNSVNVGGFDLLLKETNVFWFSLETWAV